MALLRSIVPCALVLYILIIINVLGMDALDQTLIMPYLLIPSKKRSSA